MSVLCTPLQVKCNLCVEIRKKWNALMRSLHSTEEEVFIHFCFPMQMISHRALSEDEEADYVLCSKCLL